MNNLTDRQRNVLNFICQTQNETGVVPSTREIQLHFGFLSQTAAVNHLRALERKGMIQRRAGKARAISVLGHLRRKQIIDIPLFGAIPAGLAETASQENLGMISMDASTLGISSERKVFGLNVRGDSMIGAQISDGDLAILEFRAPRSGDIVAALIDGESTLKRFVVENDSPFLRAENPRFPDLQPVGELLVQGVLVAVIRKYGR